MLQATHRSSCYASEMTVAVLIEKLKSLPQEAIVNVAGNDQPLETIVLRMTEKIQHVTLADNDGSQDQ
jgi:hypothetical protein